MGDSDCPAVVEGVPEADRDVSDDAVALDNNVDGADAVVATDVVAKEDADADATVVSDAVVVTVGAAEAVT